MSDILELVWMRDLVKRGLVRDIRMRARLTQAEIAKELGVHFSTVAYWERGQRPVGDAAIRYARLLRDLEKLIDSFAHEQATST